RFEREAKAVARLSHPNIMQVYDFDQAEDGRCFMVAELLRGDDLATRIRAKTAHGERFSLAEAVNITRSVAGALYFAHERGIVHRDIKPHNIFLTDDQRVVVTDFGIAKVICEGQLTATGTTIGTPHYFAPEQGSGQEIDFRVDIYALGVVFYELLTGHVPYDADSTLGILAQHAQAPIPDPRANRPELPHMTTVIIRRAMAKDPNARYPDMLGFVNDLDDLLNPDGLETAPDAGTVLLKSATPPPTAPIPGSAADPTLVDTPTGPNTSPSTQKPKRANLWLLVGALAAALIVIVIGALTFGGGDDNADDGGSSNGGSDSAAVTISPAAEGEYLYVVANFAGDDDTGIDATRRIVNTLSADLLAAILGERFRLEQTDQSITTREEADALAAQTGALAVIWGVQDAAGLEVVVQAHGYPDRTLDELHFMIPAGDDFSTAVANEAPLFASLYTQVLSTQRLMYDVQFIPLLLLNLNQWSLNEDQMQHITPSTPLDNYVLDLIMTFSLSGSGEEADAAATGALRLAPDDPMLYFLRWTVNALQIKRMDRAWDDARQLETLLPPGNGFATWTITATAFFDDDYEYIIDYTDTIEDHNSEAFQTAFFYRELSLFQHGQFQTVLDELNAVNPQDFEAFTGFPAFEAIRALVYEINGDEAAAEPDREVVRTSRLLEQTVEMFSSVYDMMSNTNAPPVAMLTYGGYVSEVNRSATFASMIYEIALPAHPDNYLLNWRIGVVAEQAGNYQYAYTRYMHAAENAPVPFPIVSYRLAHLIHEHGDALNDPADVCGIIVTAQTGVRTDLDFYAPLRDLIAALHQELDC
ncbi:MAG: protein kinase, partial [Anaerolineae bacterium]|nr:protein kinase [Anaerolineae bacterium]